MGEYKEGDWVICIPEHEVPTKYKRRRGTRCKELQGKPAFQVHSIDRCGEGDVLWLKEGGNGIYEYEVRPATNTEIQLAGGTPTGSGNVKRKLSDLKGEWAIICNTKEESSAIVEQLIRDIEYYKKGPVSEKDWKSKWREPKSNPMGYSKSGWCDQNWYKANGYTIYPASDFLPDTGVSSIQSEVMEEKSIKWWLSRITDPIIRGKALYNHQKHPQKHLIDKKPKNISDAISWAMLWEETEEGYTYWSQASSSNLLLEPYIEQTSNSLTNNKNQQNNGKRTEESSKYTGRSVNLQAVTTTISTGQRPRGRILSGRIQEATIRSGYLRNKVLTIK